MKTVRVRDYYERIAEELPGLQQLSKDEQRKLVTSIVTQFFKTILQTLTEDPYTIIKVYASIQKIYLRNRNAKGSLKRKIYQQFKKRQYELADLDETRMDSL